jgi:hypothetical protein
MSFWRNTALSPFASRETNSWFSRFFFPGVWSKSARHFDRLISLSPLEQRLFLKTLLLIAAVRLALWVVPYRILRRNLPRMSQPSTETVTPETAALLAQTARHVTICARFVPEATCLTQAITAQILLSHQRLTSTIRIGVARGGEMESLRAHAWLECHGLVVVGGESMTDCTAFPEIKDSRLM